MAVPYFGAFPFGNAMAASALFRAVYCTLMKVISPTGASAGEACVPAQGNRSVLASGKARCQLQTAKIPLLTRLGCSPGKIKARWFDNFINIDIYLNTSPATKG